MTGAAPKAPAAPKEPVRPRRTPIRTCVACRTAGGKRGLLRVVRLANGAGIELDPTGKKSGRGAYLCATDACVTLALKAKKLERSLKSPLTESVVEALRAAVVASESPDGTAAQ